VAIPKHLRPRWRYLAVAVETWARTDPDGDPDRDRGAGAALDRRSFQAAVWSAGRALLGDPGSADADLTVVRFEFDAAAGAGTALVRARRDRVREARAAVACVDAVDGTPVGLHVEGVAGTVRACVEKYANGPPEPTATDVVFDDRRRRAVVRGDAVDLVEPDTFTGATALDVR
jgi:ribonuclease P/MRP protein subunit POP5